MNTDLTHISDDVCVGGIEQKQDKNSLWGKLSFFEFVMADVFVALT